MKFHRSNDLVMRGSGLGSVFTTIFKNVLPFLKSAMGLGAKAAKSSIGRSVVKAAKRSALKAGLSVAADALSGQNIPKSLKRNTSRAKDSVVKAAAHAVKKQTGKKKQQQQQKKKKKVISGPHRHKPTRNRVTDIFDY